MRANASCPSNSGFSVMVRTSCGGAALTLDGAGEQPADEVALE
jgi:hypothetical protein